jgi:hypothetical protein
MRRSLLGSLLAAGLLLAPAALLPAQRPSIAGGLSAPMSDLGDAADLGYVLAVGLNTGDTDRPLAARLEGAIDDFGLKRVNQDVRVLSATANAIVNLTPGASSPYLIGGLGLYNTKFGDAASDNDLGVNLGGGAPPANGLTSRLLRSALPRGAREPRSGYAHPVRAGNLRHPVLTPRGTLRTPAPVRDALTHAGSSAGAPSRWRDPRASRAWGSDL